ncbi:MAG TPA: hypothetical protein VJA16_07845 [Thermoanaerobaculia bacterium]
MCDDLEPAFQGQLRPLCRATARTVATASQVSVAAVTAARRARGARGELAGGTPG